MKKNVIFSLISFVFTATCLFSDNLSDSLMPVTFFKNSSFDKNRAFYSDFAENLSNKIAVSDSLNEEVQIVFNEILSILNLKKESLEGDTEYLLNQMMLLKDIILSLHNRIEDLKNNDKRNNVLLNENYQELILLASYLGEVDIYQKKNKSPVFSNALAGCSAPEHLIRILIYFIKKSNMDKSLSSDFIRTIEKIKDNFSILPLKIYEGEKENNFFPLAPGGAVYQVFLNSLALNAKKNERPVEVFKSIIKKKVEDEGITSIWLMPVQFFRGFNGVNSPYGRSANALNWQFLTSREETELINYSSALGVTIYFDTVLNHTGRDITLGLQAGPYPEECYIKDAGNATFSWEGLRDVNAELDTMKLNYDNPLTWKYAYQEMASKLRRIGWNAESALKLGFRLDVAGFVNWDFWRWAIDNFKKEFGAVPPLMAEWGNFNDVESMFGKFAATYHEKVREELIAVSGSKENGFGNLPGFFQSFNDRWQYLFYIVYGNHDEHQHAMNHNPVAKIMASKGINSSTLPYPLGVFGINNGEISFEKLKIYIALNFLGFPPNAIPSYFAGDELITKAIKFLNDEPLGELTEKSVELYTGGLIENMNLSKTEKNELISQAVECYYFFKEMLFFRKIIFRGKESIIDSRLLKSDDNVWCVKFKLKNSEEYFVLLNKEAASNKDKYSQTKNLDIYYDGGSIKTTLMPYQIKIIRRFNNIDAIIFDSDGFNTGESILKAA